MPDHSVLSPSYNEASQVDRIDGRLRGADQTTTFVERIDYNARGQRTLISHGNGSVCEYSYDPLTFRLVILTTLRGRTPLQDLRYTYDPVGNPTLIRDHAQQRVFFRNQVVDPSAAYAYDALYRLIEATGREHLGQIAGGTRRPVPPSASGAPLAGLSQPGDGAAMARYTERYSYDEVGNLLRMVHHSADHAHGGWTRDYRFREPSLIEPARHSNRLTSSGPARAVAEPQQFSYDEQGNTTAMPGIPVLRWDEYDRLQATALQATDQGVPETTYYVYDATGQRIRKVTERAVSSGQASRKSERIYVGAFEVYREYAADGATTLDRETLHVFDDTRRVALVERRTAGTDRGPCELIRYQLANHLGSSVLELDHRAHVISYEEYYPYGSTSYQAVRSQTETPKRYRYIGKEHDTETGLYYHGARYYAPWLARWTSCDPARMADGTNAYLYARCQPIARTDPSGLQSQNDVEPPGEPKPSQAATGHYLVAANNPVRTVHPAGRKPPSGPQSTARAPGRADPNATGPGTSKPSSGVLGVVGAATEWFFEGAASVLSGLSWVTRNILPGLLTAPVGGAFDMLAGLTRVVGGILSLNGSNLAGGLKDIGLGFLSIFGLKEGLTEKWIHSYEKGMPTTGSDLPVTITKDIQRASQEVPENAGKNGYHAWHAADTAALSNRLGPVGSVLVWIGGFLHETPIDKKSYNEEDKAQGKVNHQLDSIGDIFANTFGILLGLLLPKIVAIKVAATLGNFIPGPADPTNPFGGKKSGKPYMGDPAVNWRSRP